MHVPQTTTRCHCKTTRCFRAAPSKAIAYLHRTGFQPVVKVRLCRFTSRVYYSLAVNMLDGLSAVDTTVIG